MPDAVTVYEKIALWGLDCPHNVSPEKAAAIYNGVGAEWMPDNLCKSLDRLSRSLLPAVMVHDIDYALGDGTLLDFQRANERLLHNGIICANAAYAWWHPLRYLVRHQAHAYSKLCNLAGLPAYVAAVKDREESDNAII